MWSNQRASPPAASLPELFADEGLVLALGNCLLPPAVPFAAAAPVRAASRAALFLLGESKVISPGSSLHQMWLFE